MGKKKKQRQMPKGATTLHEDLRVAMDVFAGDKDKVLNLLLVSGHGVQGTVGEEGSDHTIVLYNNENVPLWVEAASVLAFSIVDRPEGW